MSIMLGNLSLAQIQTRSGVNFPQELIEFMESRHQDSASNIQPGKWHCFDLPFTLVCGDMDTATTIYNHLKSMSKDFKETLSISVNN